MGSEISESIFNYDVVIPSWPLPVLVYKNRWSVEGIRVFVPSLRITYFAADDHGIGRHKPTERGVIIPGAKIIEAGFGVALFAGEFVHPRYMLACAVVHIGQSVVTVLGREGRLRIQKRQKPKPTTRTAIHKNKCCQKYLGKYDHPKY